MRGRMGPGPGVQISPRDSGWHRGDAAGRLRRHCFHGVVSACAWAGFPFSCDAAHPLLHFPHKQSGQVLPASG